MTKGEGVYMQIHMLRSTSVLCLLCMLLNLVRSSHIYHDTFGNTFQDILHPVYRVNLTVGVSRASMTIGNSFLIPGLTVHGAIILSDMALGKVPRNLSGISLEQWNTFRYKVVFLKSSKHLSKLCCWTAKWALGSRTIAVCKRSYPFFWHVGQVS